MSDPELLYPELCLGGNINIVRKIVGFETFLGADTVSFGEEYLSMKENTNDTAVMDTTDITVIKALQEHGHYSHHDIMNIRVIKPIIDIRVIKTIM